MGKSTKKLFNILISFIIVTSIALSNGTTAAAEQTTRISSFSTVSGSLNTYSGSMAKGTNTLTLNSGHDFKAGQGIAIEGAGVKESLNGWLVTSVVKVEGDKVTVADSAKSSVSNLKVSHDDTDAINRVISEANGHISFDIDNAYACGIILKSNLVLDGGKKFTVLCPEYYSDTQHCKMIYAKNAQGFTVKGFNMDGGKLRGVKGDDIFGVSMITVEDCSNFVLRDNSLQNNYYVAVQILHSAQGAEIINNTIVNTDVGVSGLPRWQGDLRLSSINISNNTIKGGTSEGICLETGMYEYGTSYGEKITIQGNTIENRKSTGIVYGSRTSNTSVRDNKINGCLNGITTRDGNLEDKAALSSKNIVISGNKISASKYQGIKIDGEGIQVSGNLIDETAAGIIAGETSASGVKITANTFSNKALNAVQGIIAYNIENTVIENNTYKNEYKNGWYSAVSIPENSRIKDSTISNNTVNEGIIAISGNKLDVKSLKILHNTLSRIEYYGKDNDDFSKAGILIGENTFRSGAKHLDSEKGKVTNINFNTIVGTYEVNAKGQDVSYIVPSYKDRVVTFVAASNMSFTESDVINLAGGADKKNIAKGAKVSFRYDGSRWNEI